MGFCGRADHCKRTAVTPRHDLCTVFANVKLLLLNLSVFANQLDCCEATHSKFDSRHRCFGSTSHYVNWQLLASCLCRCYSNNRYEKLEGNTLLFTQIPVCVFILLLPLVCITNHTKDISGALKVVFKESLIIIMEDVFTRREKTDLAVNIGLQ